MLGLCCGCTIGPRTPIESSEPAPQEANPRPAEDDDFITPMAERVTDDDEFEVPGTKASAKDWGRVDGTIGPRAPWSTLPGVANPPAHPATKTTPWTLLRTIHVGKGYLYQADFTPDHRSVVTFSGEDGEIYHYSLTGELLKKIQLPHFEALDDASIAVLQESVERPQVLITRDNSTSLLDLESGQIELLPDAPAGFFIADSGRAGLYGVLGRSKEPDVGRLTLQWISGELGLAVDAPGGFGSFSLSSDGTMLALRRLQEEKVDVLDLKKGKLLLSTEGPRYSGPVALSPSKTHLAIGGERLVLVELATGKVAFEDSSYKNNIHQIRFSQSGDLLLVSAYDGKARSYVLPADLSTLKELKATQELKHLGEANVYAISLSQDERRLVTSSGDKTLKIWERRPLAD